MRRLPTPSSLQRAANCAPSEVLPHVQTTTEGATAGTAMHKFLQDVPELGMEVALERAPDEHREAFSKIDLSRLPASSPELYVPEAAFAYDIDTRTVRKLEGVTERRYGDLKETEMALTVDVHAVLDDAVVVHDYKRGWAPVDAPRDNWQVRAYALGVARFYGKTRARAGIIRVPKGGDPWFQVEEFSEADLLAFEEEMIAAHERVLVLRAEVSILGPEKLLETHEGPWCRYCPAFAYCPSKTAQLRTVLVTPEDAEKGLISDHLTDEMAARAWVAIKSAEKLLERARAAVVTYATGKVIPLPGGLVLADQEKHREFVVGEKVYELMAEMYGPEVADKAAPMPAPAREATKKSIESALRIVLPTIPGARITKLQETTLERLREKGGVTVKKWVELAEVKPEKLKLPASSATIEGEVSR